MDAKERIGKAVVALSEFPEIGRVVRNIPETREFSADYGKSDYVFRYRRTMLEIWWCRVSGTAGKTLNLKNLS